MNATQLAAALRQLGVTAPDPLRASLYLKLLRDTQTFFTTTMALDPNVNPLGMGNNYAFVKTAVTSASLLTELAETLDLFICPAIERDMSRVFVNNPYTYQQYFNQTILDPNDVTFAANVTAFYQHFPIAEAAVQAITNNFQRNILLACRRIVQDVTAITALFEDKYVWLTLTGLKRIQSTGSDFHKGGKQVLILTFSIRHWIIGETMACPAWGELKLIYKPSDIEIDCLIIGNSAAVRRADPTFNIAASLTEIINGLIATEKQNNPQSTLETLPTYRFLPRDYISQLPQPTVYPLPIRDAYGYIEFLQYEASMGLKVWNSYPFGTSDFLIFPNQDEATIVPSFYRQMGQWLAIACTFSLQDLHLQNVRAMSYDPYLIDLEICLAKPVNNAEATGLFLNVMGTDVGGITAETVNIEEYVWRWGTNNQQQAVLDQFFPPKTYQNRLYAMRPTKRVVQPNAFYLMRGFNRAMEIIQTGVQQNSFVPWFIRINGVLVRYTPYATSDFKQFRTNIINQTLDPVNYNAQLLPTIQAELNNQLQQKFPAYQAGANPNFLALQNAVSGADYQIMDIPVFYHRIGTSDLVNSNGALVAVPAQIPINAVPTNTNIGRNDFFINPPTAAIVQQAQLQVLNADPGFTNRRVLLRNTILTGLGRQSPPKNPGTLIP